jgi:hypothetical protein
VPSVRSPALPLLSWPTAYYGDDQINCHGDLSMLRLLRPVLPFVFACRYLWSRTTKIVISDIDGTITKSDKLGHL